MKKILSFSLALHLAWCVQAQNFIPLLIDSSYAWSWSVGIDNDTFIGENYSAYSYDANDSLVQQRGPSIRFNFSYAPDTVIRLSEALDANNDWQLFSRSTTHRTNGMTANLTENYSANTWQNSALTQEFFHPSGIDTLRTIQHWANNTWVDFYKRERILDADANVVEQAEYYADGNNVLEFNRGELYEYDDLHHRIQQINLNTSVTGTYLVSRTNWAYGNDDLIDTISRCKYDFPNQGTCNPVVMSIFEYNGPDTITTKGFNWLGGAWVYAGKEIRFKGPHIYSDLPDSLHAYTFHSDTQLETPTARTYWQYMELGNDQVYFKGETFRYFENAGEWIRTSIQEAWYHLKGTSETAEHSKGMHPCDVFPNPCGPGQPLTLRSGQGQDLEVYIFDAQGRLAYSGGAGCLQAPGALGSYTLVAKQRGRWIGAAKLVVTE